jgi:hypothetical protein
VASATGSLTTGFWGLMVYESRGPYGSTAAATNG